jgi:hypothetical protein
MSQRVGRLSALPNDAQQAYGLSAAPQTLDVIDGEMRRIVDECYEEACRKLRDHRNQLDTLAEALLANEPWRRRTRTASRASSEVSAPPASEERGARLTPGRDGQGRQGRVGTGRDGGGEKRLRPQPLRAIR